MVTPKIVLYLLGKKGFNVLNATILGGSRSILTLVVVGQDNNVLNDSSEEIIDLCRKHGIEYCLRNDSLLACEKLENFIAIAAGWRWLIKESFHQVIVFHDSLLPKYRGFNPLVTALLNCDIETGVSAIIANKEFDRGDVIEVKSMSLTYPVKINNIIDEIAVLYFEITLSILNKLKEAKYLVGTPQDETLASYSVWRNDEDYRIDWSTSAASIVHFINCLSFPYKGASALLEGKLIRIIEGAVVPDVAIVNRDVGKVLFINEKRPVVICGVGLVRIDVAVDEYGQSVLPFRKFRMRLR
jgi:methionyl-tRNA formyltransferase